jgi:PAS domain-containing protein
MASPDQIGSSESDSQQEIELRRIVNLTPQMITVLDPDGRITWVNEVTLDYLGVSLADVSADDVGRIRIAGYSKLRTWRRTHAEHRGHGARDRHGRRQCWRRRIAEIADQHCIVTKTWRPSGVSYR